MRKYYYLIFTAVLWNSSFAQETTAFDQSFDPIRAELEEWDPIRGPWLSSSLEAMSKQEPIPDRTFPEDITPSQMVNALPTRTRDNVERFAQNEVGGEEADQEH